MKKLKLLLLAIPFTMISCYQDMDDNLERQEVIPDPIDDNQFITEDGEIFSTGLECTGTGNYSSDGDVLSVLVIPENLPEEFDLSEMLPPVGDQGQLGSCSSWAVSYYLKSFQEYLENDLPYSAATLRSPSFTYNQLTMGECGGTSIAATLDLVQEQGVCSLASFPYDDSDCAEQPNEAQIADALEAQISEFKSLSGENMTAEMKTLLTRQQPILIGAYLSSEFGKTDNFGLAAYREHVVNYGNGDCHAMLVVGYSDEYNAFKVVNSWGENWGSDGFVWIDYAAFENASDPSANFRVINNAYVAYNEIAEEEPEVIF
ncbi:C1 family peptidase [Zunongwangia endophytica]|uniref:C1 family peptidase n=1 Tax=Zunongwangia endophytica TaxID=1808945 RepID=A0ABV8H6I3_9FLAO|nr:C1 family peptidase [Zunongwangia endophytica]MDN3595719.1 C1 family peptidase [Zunongwangia endophytica]